MSFLEAANLALNNEKNVSGIVINAFSNPFEIPREVIGIVTGIDLCKREGEDNE